MMVLFIGSDVVKIPVECMIPVSMSKVFTTQRCINLNDFYVKILLVYFGKLQIDPLPMEKKSITHTAAYECSNSWIKMKELYNLQGHM